MNSNIHYTDQQYASLRDTYRRWWNNDLNRPIVPIITFSHPSNRQPSPHPTLEFPTAWDFSISPEQFIDAQDWRLSTMRFHGEAFPYFHTTPFGPGVMAAFLGCTPHGAKNTVWFASPDESIPLQELHFSFDPNNRYFRRVADTILAAMDRWHGQVVVGMPDLGGVLDVLSSFRGPENLLMDLYDDPEEVLRCVNELHELWHTYFNYFHQLMAPEAQGYTHWFNLFSEEPGYILQSDFSYMISPEMFDQFVGPELVSSANKIPYAVYHMDGIGQIPHLDSLLANKNCRGIQWVPGSGVPEQQNWDELLKKILASGKKLLSWNQLPDGHPVPYAENPGQLYFGPRWYPASALDDARTYGSLYGISVNPD